MARNKEMTMEAFTQLLRLTPKGGNMLYYHANNFYSFDAFTEHCMDSLGNALISWAFDDLISFGISEYQVSLWFTEINSKRHQNGCNRLKKI